MHVYMYHYNATILDYAIRGSFDYIYSRGRRRRRGPARGGVHRPAALHGGAETTT